MGGKQLLDSEQSRETGGLGSQRKHIDDYPEKRWAYGRLYPEKKSKLNEGRL